MAANTLLVEDVQFRVELSVRFDIVMMEITQL
jgi:hypothetical protein